MFSLKLFFAFEPDEQFKIQQRKANPYFFSLFIGKEEYLQEISHQGKYYLGKYLPPFPTLDYLEDIEKHLLSLLVKLAPEYPFFQNPPFLVTLQVA